jgi:hypothetical protein
MIEASYGLGKHFLDIDPAVMVPMVRVSPPNKQLPPHPLNPNQLTPTL